MLFAGLTAIKITHPIALGNFNNEIFQIINPLTSVTVDVFFGGESAKNTGGRSYWLKFHVKNGSFTHMQAQEGIKIYTQKMPTRFGAKV